MMIILIYKTLVSLQVHTSLLRLFGDEILRSLSRLSECRNIG